MKPILVTGGAGYIGSHTAYLLAQRGYPVVILDTFVHDQYFNPSWATVARGDCADSELLQFIVTRYGIKAVMHFAANIEVGRSMSFPLEFYQANVATTITLLDEMIRQGIKHFIFSSSCAVYGTPATIPLTEEHTLAPLSPYGKTKAMIETMLHDMHKAYGLQYAALRYFNAAGALPEEGLGEQHKQESHLIPLALQSALKQTPFTIFGNDYPTKDGTCVRDFVHVLDIAQAHVLALEHSFHNSLGDCFNLGTGFGYSVKEIINTVEKVCKAPIKTVIEKKREGDPHTLVADPSKAHTILGWRPRYSNLDFMLRSALAYETVVRPTQSRELATIL